MQIKRIITIVLVFCLVSSLTGQGGTLRVSRPSSTETVSCLAPLTAAAKHISSPENVMRRIVEDMRANSKSNPSVAPETVMKRVLKAVDKTPWIERAKPIWRRLNDGNSFKKMLPDILIAALVVGGGNTVFSLTHQGILPILAVVAALALVLTFIGRKSFTSAWFRSFAEQMFSREAGDNQTIMRVGTVIVVIISLVFSAFGLATGVSAWVIVLFCTIGYLVLLVAATLAFGKMLFPFVLLIREASKKGYTVLQETAESFYGSESDLLKNFNSDKYHDRSYSVPSFPVARVDGVPTDKDIEDYVRQLMSTRNPLLLKSRLNKMGPAVDRYIDAVRAQNPIDPRDLYHLRLFNLCVVISYWHNMPEVFDNDLNIFSDLCHFALARVGILPHSNMGNADLKYGVLRLEEFQQEQSNNDRLFMLISHEIGHNLQRYNVERVFMDQTELASRMELYAMLSSLAFSQIHGINPDIIFEEYNHYLLGSDKFTAEHGLDPYEVLDGFIDRDRMEYYYRGTWVPHARAVYSIFYLTKLGYDPKELLMAFRAVEKDYDTTEVDIDFVLDIGLLNAA